MPLCIDCQHFANLTSKTTGGGVEFEHEEFLAWKREDPARRECSYCGIDGEQLYAMNAINVRTKKRFEDRRRPDRQQPSLTGSTTFSRAARSVTV